MTPKPALRIEAASPGRLMNAAEIAAEKFSGKKKPRWVRSHVPGRLPGSREALWFESVVDAFIETLRKSA